MAQGRSTNLKYCREKEGIISNYDELYPKMKWEVLPVRKVAILFSSLRPYFVVACSNSSTPIPSPTENSVTDALKTPYSNNVIETIWRVCMILRMTLLHRLTILQQIEFMSSINSDKYHYPFCQWAQEIYPENEIWFSSEEEAQASGYVPCKVCRP